MRAWERAADAVGQVCECVTCRCDLWHMTCARLDPRAHRCETVFWGRSLHRAHPKKTVYDAGVAPLPGARGVCESGCVVWLSAEARGPAHRGRAVTLAVGFPDGRCRSIFGLTKVTKPKKRGRQRPVSPGRVEIHGSNPRLDTRLQRGANLCALPTVHSGANRSRRRFRLQAPQGRPGAQTRRRHVSPSLRRADA